MGDVAMTDNRPRMPREGYYALIRDHHDDIWEAIDNFRDYRNQRWKCSVEEIIAQVAPRFPMCSFTIVTNDHEELLTPKINIVWEDKIKKPKPILPDDTTNLVRPPQFNKARAR
jgi:hypothetical protein